jgi:hypothetical protein
MATTTPNCFCDSPTGSVNTPLNVTLTNSQGGTMLFFLQTASGPIPLKIESVNSNVIILAHNGPLSATNAYQQPVSINRENGPNVTQSINQMRDPPVIGNVQACRAPDADVRESRLRHVNSKPESIAAIPSQSYHMPIPKSPALVAQSFAKLSNEQLYHRTPSPEMAIAQTGIMDNSPVPQPEMLHRDTRYSRSQLDRAISEQHRAVTSSGLITEPRRKIYCSHWIKTGTCSFGQTGCKYRHEMPPREYWECVGIKALPQWYTDHLARNQRVVHASECQEAINTDDNDGDQSEKSGLAKGLENLSFEHRARRVPTKPKMIIQTSGRLSSCSSRPRTPSSGRSC